MYIEVNSVFYLKIAYFQVNGIVVPVVFVYFLHIYN